MLRGAHKDWLIHLTAARCAELRVMRDIAALTFSPGHPQVLELARQVQIAEEALAELRTCARQEAA
jgi:hypothetical protein